VERPVVAIIGAGKIGSAMAARAVECGYRVVATGRRRETLEAASRAGAEALRDNKEAVRRASLVVLSVKPVHVPGIISEIGGLLEGRALLSVVAGVRRGTLEAATRAEAVYRAMPNINVLVGKSTTAVTGPRGTGWDGAVEEFLSCMGSVYWVPEEWLDPWTALVGSAPAYLAVLIDALVLGGVAVGLPRDLGLRAVLDTVRATADLLEERPVHPAEVRDEVTTPAGTTIEALKVIEERGVTAALIRVVEAATRRAQELGALIDEEVRRSLGLERG